MYVRQILGTTECKRVHILPYGKFNGDMSVKPIFSAIAFIGVVGAKKFNY